MAKKREQRICISCGNKIMSRNERLLCGCGQPMVLCSDVVEHEIKGRRMEPSDIMDAINKSIKKWDIREFDNKSEFLVWFERVGAGPCGMCLYQMMVMKDDPQNSASKCISHRCDDCEVRDRHTRINGVYIGCCTAFAHIERAFDDIYSESITVSKINEYIKHMKEYLVGVKNEIEREDKKFDEYIKGIKREII